jgi:hypothetical protein
VPVAGELESRFGGEAAVAGSGRDDLVDPVGAHYPVGAGYDVPGAGLQDQAVRLQPPANFGRLLPSPVGDLDDLAVPECAGHDWQVGHVLGAAIPAGGIEVEALGQAVGVLAKRGGQRGPQFQRRGRQYAAEAKLGRGPGQPG